MTLAAPYRAVPFRRLIVQRLSDSPLPLPEALVEVIGVLERSGICPQLRYAGVPPTAIEPSASRMAEYIAQVRRDRENHIPTIFCLSGEPGSRGSSLFLDFDESSTGPIDVLWTSLADTLTGGADASQRLSEALTETCTLLGAFHGAVEDEHLSQLYRGQRAVERARRVLPPELRQYIPEPPTSTGGFPSLLVPAEFDQRTIPDAVWWINFWDAIQVSAVQLSKIETAGFARLLPQQSGALLLIASERVIDTNNPSDLHRLAGIVEHLELRQLQEGAQTQ